MSIAPISNSEAWARFLQVTEAARTRSMAKSAPLAVRESAQGAKSAGLTGNYALGAQEKQGVVLGTKFDAYA